MHIIRKVLSAGSMACGHELWIYINGFIQHGQMIVRYHFAPRVSSQYIFTTLNIIKGFSSVDHGFGEGRVFLLQHGYHILIPI